MRVAALYFLKAAELGAVPLRFANTLLVLAVVGSLTAIARWWEHESRGAAVALGTAAFLRLFGCLRFGSDLYSALVAALLVQHPLWHGDVADLRSLARVAYGLPRRRGPKLYSQVVPLILSAILFLIVIDSWAVARATPLVLQEAFANSRSRMPFEQALAAGSVAAFGANLGTDPDVYLRAHRRVAAGGDSAEADDQRGRLLPMAVGAARPGGGQLHWSSRSTATRWPRR